MPTVSRYHERRPAFVYSSADGESVLLSALRSMVAMNPDQNPNDVTAVTKDGSGVMNVSFGSLSFSANPGAYVVYDGTRFRTYTSVLFEERYAPVVDQSSFTANVQLDVSGTAIIERL